MTSVLPSNVIYHCYNSESKKAAFPKTGGDTKLFYAPLLFGEVMFHSGYELRHLQLDTRGMNPSSITY